MATWVTHLMIADGVMKCFPSLDRRGFCVGNIAPDCNIENADWTAFTPTREVTHWMREKRKKASDSDAFCEKYITSRRDEIKSPEEYAFLLGYYAHLIIDAAFQAMIRNEERVKAAWDRIMNDDTLAQQAAGMEHSWDNAKKLIPKRVWTEQIYHMEGEYLSTHPDSGYMTEILPLKKFPDYIDYLPSGAIVRKIGVMGYLPSQGNKQENYIAISCEEYKKFVDQAIDSVVVKFKEMNLV